MTPQRPHLVLIGGGHAHLLLLKNWQESAAKAAIGDVSVTLISTNFTSVYSGMVPGVLSGIYSPEECQVDLAKLARASAAEFVQGEVVGIDTESREVILHDSNRIAYDVLSIDVGARSQPGQSLHELLALERAPLQRPQEVVVIGGGAAGVELALSMATAGHHVSIYERANRLLPSMPSWASHIVLNRARELNLDVHLGVTDAAVEKNKSAIQIMATGPQAAIWLRATKLPLTRDGFIRVDGCLRVLGYSNIFAVGDCAEFVEKIPRSGVYAVREAPVLLENALCVLAQKPENIEPSVQLQLFRPQKRALYLLSLGGSEAMLAWGPFAVAGPKFFRRLLWRLKQRIDRRYVEGLKKSEALTSELF